MADDLSLRGDPVRGSTLSARGTGRQLRSAARHYWSAEEPTDLHRIASSANAARKAPRASSSACPPWARASRYSAKAVTKPSSAFFVSASPPWVRSSTARAASSTETPGFVSNVLMAFFTLGQVSRRVAAGFVDNTGDGVRDRAEAEGGGATLAPRSTWLQAGRARHVAATSATNVRPNMASPPWS
jgi:hypothetical protein